MSNKFLREQEILNITKLSRSTRLRLEQQGKFPKRYRISDGIHAYKEADIMEWLDSRPEEGSNAE